MRKPVKGPLDLPVVLVESRLTDMVAIYMIFSYLVTIFLTYCVSFLQTK